MRASVELDPSLPPCTFCSRGNRRVGPERQRVVHRRHRRQPVSRLARQGPGAPAGATAPALSLTCTPAMHACHPHRLAFVPGRGYTVATGIGSAAGQNAVAALGSESKSGPNSAKLKLGAAALGGQGSQSGALVAGGTSATPAGAAAGGFAAGNVQGNGVVLTTGNGERLVGFWGQPLGVPPQSRLPVSLPARGRPDCRLPSKPASLSEPWPPQQRRPRPWPPGRWWWLRARRPALRWARTPRAWRRACRL